MRAAVVEQAGAPLLLTQIPDPSPGPGEVLLQVGACGVCFTDLKVAEGLIPDVLPLIPGHEPVGTVAETGLGVEGLAAGDRVGVHAVFACEECPSCSAGYQQMCVNGPAALAGIGHHGGYAELMTAPAASLVKLPDELGFADAAPLFCAGLTSFAGLRRAGLAPGQRVAVIGVGGLGHLAISIAAAMAAEVYAVTGSPDKVATAMQRGAAFAGDGAAVAEELQRAGGADVVLNTSDGFGPLLALVPGLAKRASVVLAAGLGDGIPIPPTLLMMQQAQLIGTFFGSRQDLRDLLALAAEHQIRPEVERYPLAEANAVHDRLRQNAVRYRAVLEP